MVRRHLVPVLTVLLAILTAVTHGRPTQWQALSSGKDAPPPLIIRPASQQAQRMGGGLPLLIGLHPQGETAARFFDTLEYLAGRSKVIAVLPQGQIPFNRGYQWGSVSNAEALILEALNKVREKSLIDPRNIVLMGFSDSANLACLVALRNVVPVSAVVAFGPFIDSAEMAQLPAHAKTLRRVVVLCTEDDPGFQRCVDSATLLKAVGVVVNLRKMDAESARFGRDRMREALNLTLERER